MKELMSRVRESHPLIHCITNCVTVNDCANLLLACGASPIMADDAGEVEDITSICNGLVLNIGTLNANTIPAMFRAGRKAKELHHPVILDPVGAGASALRTGTARSLLSEIQPDILRCNISEFKVLYGHHESVSRGVDAAELDRLTGSNLKETAEMLRKFAAGHQCVIGVSGAIDLIAAPDGRVCAIRNGHPMMEDVTGSGCMLSALTAAYAAACPESLFEAVCAAFEVMGIAGEAAYCALKQQTERMGDEIPKTFGSLFGNAGYREWMINAVYSADPEKWERLVRCEML